MHIFSPIGKKYVSKRFIYFQANKHERSKKSPTFKDLDFDNVLPEGILLGKKTKNP